MQTSRPVVLNRGARAPPEGRQAISRRGEPLHALQHGTFLNCNVSIPNVTFCHVAVHLHDTTVTF